MNNETRLTIFTAMSLLARPMRRAAAKIGDMQPRGRNISKTSCEMLVGRLAQHAQVLALSLLTGCASLSGAADVRITAPATEQTVGPKFQIAWQPAGEILTVVVHAEGNPIPTIKELNKRSGETYQITSPGHYIVKAWIEGRALPEHEVWFNVAAQEPTTKKKAINIVSPENGSEVSGWFKLAWSEDQLLTVVFYQGDQAILKARSVRSGSEFALAKAGLTEMRFFLEDRNVPVASTWFTVKASPSP